MRPSSAIILSIFLGISVVFAACNDGGNGTRRTNGGGGPTETTTINSIDVELWLEEGSLVVEATGYIEENRAPQNTLVLEHGFYYGYEDRTDYEQSYTKIVSEEPVDEFFSEIPVDATRGDVFYCVAYARTAYRTFFSGVASLELSKEGSGGDGNDDDGTGEGGDDPAETNKMQVELSQDYTDLTFERVTVSGSCSTSDERNPITERGFCYLINNYATGKNPTLADNHVAAEGTGSGAFSATLRGLSSGIHYRVRAYAKSAAGITYSSTHRILVMSATSLFVPYVTAMDHWPSQGLIEGGIPNDRGYAVTEKGFCYNTEGVTPTINDTKIVIGKGLGTFTFDTSELPAGTYFFRAYAINQAGIGYSYRAEEMVVP